MTRLIVPGAARRSVALLFLAALTLPPAMAGEWDNEGKELEQDCSGPFLSLVSRAPRFCSMAEAPSGFPFRRALCRVEELRSERCMFSRSTFTTGRGAT